MLVSSTLACASLLVAASVQAGRQATPAPAPSELLGGCSAQWVPTWGGWAGVDGSVEDLAVFDDGLGDGPQLYVGGAFLRAGDVDVFHVARWNGVSWFPVGDGLGTTFSGTVRALFVFDDRSGAGPRLYAGGSFPGGSVARWNGREWDVLPSPSGTVWAFAAFDDGRGPALHAGGSFPGGNIARWDGTQWLPLGGGLGGPTGVAFASVVSLAVFDDGNGPALFAGGGFTSAGGVPASAIARWDGTAWAPLDSGVDRGVTALHVFDDGSGPALFVAGFFTHAGAISTTGIARWTSTGWASAGVSGAAVHALGVLPDANGGPSTLYATGFGGQLRRWNGISWVSEVDMLDRVDALAAYDDGRGGGPELYLGGVFTHQGDGVNTIVSRRIARWNGTRWRALAQSVDGTVEALVDLDQGAGPVLAVGGRFEHAGEKVVHHVALWDGTDWMALGGGTDAPVAALASFDDRGRGGPELVAGGEFTSADGTPASRIAAWNRAGWHPLGKGVDGPVLALLAHEEDGRPVLDVGGAFMTAGGRPASRVARWDGREWSPLGAGFDGAVRALVLHVEGGVPRLHAGGDFRNAGGVPVDRIARWNGTDWEPVGLQGGMNAPVRALVSFEHPLHGRSLIAGGDFTAVGTSAVERIARWNGFVWQPLAGGGVNNAVRALQVFDPGSGADPLLLVGGDFALAGGASLGHLISWNGQRYARFAQWVGDDVHALSTRAPHGGKGAMVHVGGPFPVAQPGGDSHLARFQRCPDDTPPRLLCPTALVVVDSPADGPGEVVRFSVDAIDDLDLLPLVICSPPSGSRFPPGTTRVHCKAIDGSGNATSCEFSVLVRPPLGRWATKR